MDTSKTPPEGRAGSKKPRLTAMERLAMETGLDAGKTPYAIAQELGRPPKTVMREIRGRAVESDKGAVGRVNNPELFTVSEKTLYRYIDGGLLSTKNGDLPRKCRLKPRKGKGEEHIQSQDVGLITCNTEKLDKTFAYYLFLTHSVREQISARSQQTKIRHTSPDKIADVEVHIPNMPTQLRIAGVMMRS